MELSNLHRTISCPEQVADLSDENNFQKFRGSDDNLRICSEEKEIKKDNNLCASSKKDRKNRKHPVRKEFEKVFNKFRNKVPKSKNIDDSMNPKPITNGEIIVNKRTLNVESSYQQYSRKKCQSQDSVMDFEENTEFFHRDYTQTLQILPLADFKFQAIFDLKNLPPTGNITIYVGDNKISFYLLDGLSKKKRSTYLKNLGFLSLPMYIDPSKIEFELMENSMLLIEATLKGILSRRMSMSTDNLSDRSKVKKIKTPLIRRKSNCIVEWDISQYECKY